MAIKVNGEWSTDTMNRKIGGKLSLTIASTMAKSGFLPKITMTMKKTARGLVKNHERMDNVADPWKHYPHGIDRVLRLDSCTIHFQKNP